MMTEQNSMNIGGAGWYWKQFDLNDEDKDGGLNRTEFNKYEIFGCCHVWMLLSFPFLHPFLCTSNYVTVGTIRDNVNTPTHEICCMVMNLRRKGNNACDDCVHYRRAMAEV
jgi:hypothetical protein